MSIALIARYAVDGKQRPISKVVAIAPNISKAAEVARSLDPKGRFLGWDYAEIDSPSVVPR